MLDCLKCLKKIDFKKTGIFAAGVLFGTAGVKILASKDARKLYTNCTAAALRAKSTVMKTVTSIQENAEDIYAEAQQINEDRVADSFIDDDFEDVEDLVGIQRRILENCEKYLTGRSYRIRRSVYLLSILSTCLYGCFLL